MRKAFDYVNQAAMLTELVSAYPSQRARNSDKIFSEKLAYSA